MAGISVKPLPQPASNRRDLPRGRVMLTGLRRNLMAALAGAAFAATLGTAIALGMAGTASNSGLPGNPPTGYDITEDAAGFSLYTPKGWEHIPGFDDGHFSISASFYSPVPHGQRIEVGFPFTPGSTPYEKLKSIEHSLSHTDGYRKFRFERIGSESDGPTELEYAYRDATQVRHAIIRTFFGLDGRVREIGATGSTDDWSDTLAHFNVAITSFCITGYPCAR
jgi:hypothetical protein